jgi:two-component system response regulator AtoC
MKPCGHRLLVVEDEPILRVTIADALRKEGWEVDVVEDGAKALTQFERHRHEVILTDLLMPRMDGLELLRRVKALQTDTTVVIITAHGTIETAVEAMRLGAADFIAKPFSMVQLVLRLDNVCSFRLLKEQNIRLQEQLERRFSFGKIIGKSKRMLEVFELIKVVAESDASVLIQGESGTGKELVASAIHYNSVRRARPYIRVSCASLPESLLESELFGYEKGAFTGASERRIGRFEAASGGTLFLDEIGELPLSFQVKLLRVLQELQIERLGSQRPIDVNVRIVAASLRPLEEEIAEGLFREDLFFRINTVTIHLPPLRERREDIPILATSFLEEFGRERRKAIEGFSDGVLEAFDAYHWAGNVRELRNVVERAALFCRKPRITPEDLPANLRTASPPPRRAPAQQTTTLHEAVEQAEIEAIRAALSRTEGRRNEAAQILGVSRKTLWEKTKHYGLENG